ncbi:MAG: transcriptional regulator [Ignavibacteriales bacterium CG12_big_fil_rev_8_21_14_0_65_30_8]|nr:MAG: transcriptional regulator [Ignavibacteriales bacterium CG12_big_fil_rev_8_21_14_0_65_30_8]
MISPRYVREIPQRYRLEASKCKCGKINFPLRLVCPSCKSREFETITLSDEGKILTYTIIRVASDIFSRETPYAVAIIETKDGGKLTAMIADSNLDDVKIGKKVRLEFRKIQDEGVSGLHCYGYKAIVT